MSEENRENAAGEEVIAAYRCPEDGQEWSGIKGVVPTNCPQCGIKVDEIPVKADEQDQNAGTDETGAINETDSTGGSEPDYAADKSDENADKKSEEDTAKYRITGLVDIFDEQNVITGQYPVGSVQKLTVVRGDEAIQRGAAELVPEGEE